MMEYMFFDPFTTIVIVITLSVIILVTYYINYRIETYSWIRITSKVYEIIVERTGGDGPQFYKAKLILTYTVGEKLYRKTVPTQIKEPVKRRFHKNGLTIPEVKVKTAMYYPIGSNYELYFNPKNPFRSDVKKGLPYSVNYFVWVSFCLLGLSIFFLSVEILFGQINLNLISFILNTILIAIIIASSILTLKARDKILKYKDVIIDNKSYYKAPDLPKVVHADQFTSSIQQEEGSSQQPRDQFCSKCGTMISEDDRYCSGCFTKI